MSRWIRVLKVPEGGYFVIGERTLSAKKGAVAEVHDNELKDVDNLVRDNSVEYIAPPPAPT